MSDIRIHIDGAPYDGVGHDLASPNHLARYKEAADALSRLKVPVLVHVHNPHEKLFIAAFDGTGNNKFLDPAHATNVAKIDDAIGVRNRHGDGQVYSEYVEGPGTQGSWLLAKTDAAMGHSYESNIEDAYDDLVRKANRWAMEDPETVVRVHSIGFSRGASQVPGFARLVHERGVPALDSRIDGSDGVARFSRYIAPPGQVVQTVGIFDAVATGAPMKFDRRLPPSVVSGFQITAADELRKSFPSHQIIPPGLSEDGRFLNVMVPGAHSDVGGGYLRDGLSIRCGNLMRDYCNALRDVPYLEKEFEPIDQRLNVIHRSTEGEVFFRMDPRTGVRGHPSGTNEVLVPRHVDPARMLPHRPEALDPRLEEGLSRRQVVIGPANDIPSRTPLPAVSRDQVLDAARSSRFAQKLVHQGNVLVTAADGAMALNALYTLQKHGNAAGEDSVAVHYLSRNVAGIGGAQGFMALGAAAGMETGPGMVITGAIGGVVGFIAGDKVADEYDHYRISHQKDAHGNTWRLDEKQAWTRDVPPLPEAPQGQRLIADAALSSRLSYQSATTAVEIALAKEYRPRDPFVQPASSRDTPSVADAPWIHNHESHQWTREVIDRYLEHGVVSSHRETATQDRALELDRLAEETVALNVQQSPLGVAERYRLAYQQREWAAQGPVPPAVEHALRTPTDKVMASDGHKYARGPEGEWERPGMVYGANSPKGTVREELDMAERAVHGMKGGATTTQTQHRPAAPSMPIRLDDPSHPDHAFFNQVRDHVVALDKSLGRSPDHYTGNIASALTVQARADGLKRVDEIDLSEDGSALWAIQTPPGQYGYLFELTTRVPTNEANTPMEQSGAKWPQAMQQFQDIEEAKVEAQQKAQERAQAASQAGPSMNR